jgi:hypothetical protein
MKSLTDTEFFTLQYSRVNEDLFRAALSDVQGTYFNAFMCVVRSEQEKVR